MSVAATGPVSNEETDTIFSIYPHNFPDLKGGEKINTSEFLLACKGVVLLIEKLGKVFSPVIYDIQGNIKKITTKYNENPKMYVYLEDMILAEKLDGGNVTIDALMWLRRGLHFTLKFFEYIYIDSQNDDIRDNLAHYLKTAYSETLERYHGWLGSQLFNILCRFAPTKKDFFLILALDRHHKEEYVIRDVRIFVESLSKVVKQLQEFYTHNELEAHYRV